MAKHLEGLTFFRRGETYVAPCPLHTPGSEPGSDTESFCWSPARNVMHCFWCGYGGVIDSREIALWRKPWPETMVLSKASVLSTLNRSRRKKR